MAESYPYEELHLISNGLYRILSDIIGPECIVKLRRQGYDIEDYFLSCDTSLTETCMTSGSKAEGFKFKTSDHDYMAIDKTIIVLNGNSCHISNRTNFPSVLLMETDNVSPGFTLLRCLRCDYRNSTLYNALELRGIDAFVNSRLLRDSYLIYEGTTIHGPCVSGVMEGEEYDYAYTLKCPFWPKQAESFIYRSIRHAWPSFGVLTDICKDGCLLVPINSKQHTCSDLTDLEWRISFSLAEKKLIYSMNHCQFLAYGLMKVILNNILKKIPETGDLLCSYFMKTAVFWEISERANGWSPWNFIYKFWNIFRRLMKWISIGYCPNFFIPQHNMFCGKIYGSHQKDLMLRLGSLYNEGYMYLLRCTSLDKKFSMVINLPLLVNLLLTCINENYYVTLTRLDKEKLTMIIKNSTDVSPINDSVAMMRMLCNTAVLIPTSEEMTSAVKLRVNSILQRIGVALHSPHALSNQRNSTQGTSNQSHIPNRLRYRFIKTGQSILKRTQTYLCQNTINLAVCSYRNGEYYRTIQIVHCIKQRLQRQPYMYWFNLNDDIITTCRQQGMSYEEMVKSFIIHVYYYTPEVSVEEIYLESKARLYNFLFIPPLVFYNFLLILSYTRLKETSRRNDALFELQTLLYHDDGYHNDFISKAISWEILGICQQLCGDYHGAYQSYINALNDQNNDFKKNYNN